MKPSRTVQYAVAVAVATLVFATVVAWRDGGTETTVLVPTTAATSTTAEAGGTEPEVSLHLQPKATGAIGADTPPSTSFPVGDAPSDATADEIVDEPGDPSAPDAPALPVPVGTAPGDDPAAGAMPEVNPVGIDGAETTFYLPSNSAQAAMLGLQPGQVRTWGMTFAPSGDHTLDHLRIVDGLVASGVAVQVDMLTGSVDGSGMLGGDWGGYIINVIVGNWTSITVNLIDLP